MHYEAPTLTSNISSYSSSNLDPALFFSLERKRFPTFALVILFAWISRNFRKVSPGYNPERAKMDEQEYIGGSKESDKKDEHPQTMPNDANFSPKNLDNKSCFCFGLVDAFVRILLISSNLVFRNPMVGK